MAKKKHKKKPGAAYRQAGDIRQAEPVRLSQCMIVKNEEKNIEKALSWGRGIVCEQIVVDTGSTDRTVEIAESMGATVLHFKWINDFAAAKNFAIEQTSGNWVALLDADEYIPDEDTKNVIPLLEKIMSDPKMRRDYLAVNCPWVQLNEAGVTKEILTQERIFRNLPDVRYVGRIHEGLSLVPKNVVHTKLFRIMHTGYTGETFITTEKTGRNIKLLREELKANPKDLNLKGYLAESLLAEAVVERTVAGDEQTKKRAEEKFKEVESLFKEVADSRAEISTLHKKSAYDFFMTKYSSATVVVPEYDKMSLKAHREFPDDHKFACHYAMALNKKHEYRAAFDVLKSCEESLEKATGNSSELTTVIMELLATQMIFAAQGLGDIKNVLKYAELLLLMNKTNESVLQPYIATLKRYHDSNEEVLDALARVYDMSSKRDLILIARCAKNCGEIDLARRIIEVTAHLGTDNE